MNRSMWALWIFVTCLYGTAQQVPCSGPSHYETIPCVGPNGCKSFAYVNRPLEGHEFYYSCDSVDCCGQLITDCTTGRLLSVGNGEES